MSVVTSFNVADEPVEIVNNDGASVRTYLICNQDAALAAELLGTDPATGDPQALGEGIPFAAGRQVAVEFASGETLWAAAASPLEMRVLELHSA